MKKLFSSALSLRKKQQSEFLDSDLCESISMLMNSGFSFQQTLILIKTEKNAHLIEELQRHMENGESAADFLPQMCRGSFGIYLSGFLQYMDLASALSSVTQIVKEEKEEKRALIKGCLYPCLLLAGMTAGIFLFATFLLPVMLSMMNSMHVTGGADYEAMRVWIRLFSAFTALCAVCAVFIAVYATRRNRIEKTYRAIAPRFPDSLPVIFASRDFVRFFLECSRRSISTRQSLQILKRIEGKPLVALIADELDRSLMEGASFEHAMSSPFVESALSRFIHLAALSGQCDSMLEGYLTMSKKRSEASIRRFSTAVQLFSYTLIGIVLIFVYSILMMPMNMLQML